MPGIMGFQIEAGESVLRPDWHEQYAPPRRRLFGGLFLCRAGGDPRSEGCAQDDTGGPEPTPVPKVGGAPGAVGVEVELVEVVCLLQAAAATSTPSGAVIRNWRRVFMAGKPTLRRCIDQAA